MIILERISKILSFDKIKLRDNSFFDSQLPTVLWFGYLYNRTLNNKINKLHERSLEILYKENCSSFEQLLLNYKSVTMHDRNVHKFGNKNLENYNCRIYVV